MTESVDEAFSLRNVSILNIHGNEIEETHLSDKEDIVISKEKQIYTLERKIKTFFTSARRVRFIRETYRNKNLLN